jgi:class 3 adenylate cyclase
MKQTNWQSFFSMRNIFLYFVVVILPVLVSFFAIQNMILEQHLAQKDILSQQLELQAAKIPLVTTDEYQFKDFFTGIFTSKNLLKSKPEDIARLIDHIDKLYPGAFKWIFWNKNARVIDIKSKTILEGKRSWETLFANLMKRFNLLGNDQVFSTTDHFKSRIGYSLNVLQRAMGDDVKVEHMHGAREKPIHAEWFGKKCMIIWGIDVVSYQYENVPKEIRGGCLLMGFKEALGEDFWLKRLLKRRPRLKNLLPFPVMAINLSEQKPVFIEEKLKFPGIAQKVLKAYIERNNSIFECDNMLIKASTPEEGSVLRIFSIADLSKINNERDNQLQILNVSMLLLFILSTLITAWLLQQRKTVFSLRKRIGLLFLVAILLPVLSLISIGKTFLSHEEKRLYETAYLEMEKGLEALELRYKDAPRLVEKNLFKDVQDLIGPRPYDLAKVKQALDKAVADDMVKNYIVGDTSGKFILDNWPQIHPAIKNALQLSFRKMLEVETDMKSARKSVLRQAMDEELEDLLSTMQAALDISRPSHLRYYCFQDFHMYFMSATIWLDEKPHGLLLHIPDYYLEKLFSRKEFAKNIMATGANEKKNYELRSELLFYSRFKADPHLPEHTELWKLLEKEFNRSFQLKVKETGRITLDGEKYLYTIKPLRTMYRQSYIPCMLTTTKQIEKRLRDVRITIFALAAFASLGAVLLSLVLAGSLLGPIQSIDSAAQQVGKGDLTVNLPEMGNDELGRLSKTFNDMVKGLRERERMQAYVSDSVLEAVQDHADPTLGAGKIIEATILFSDIRNFTGLTEQYRPDKIFSLLNEFLGGVEPLIRANHGRVDKFIGDAVMAVFHDSTSEHHSLSAVKAAVAMKKFVKNLNLKRKKLGLFTINIGIGISTGRVLLGDVGSSRRKDLTVIGDEVNLAARLETASKQGRHSRIIISASTYANVRKEVEVEEMPFTEIRGKKQAVKIYELIKLF